jgi:hypothetical protein
MRRATGACQFAKLREERGRVAGFILSQKGDALADGIFGQLGNAIDTQLVHDLLAVGFHSFSADVKSRCYFSGGFAFCNELENLSFTL